MIYFATPSSPDARARMTVGQLGWIDTPKQANIRPSNVTWCADNGCYTGGTNWKPDHWWSWLQRHAPHAEQCAFATAPDVLGDAAATLDRAAPWLPRIRQLGYPAGYVAQDGITDTSIPWDSFDVLFIGGTDAFKFSADAITTAAQAKARGKWVHCGRINSLRRWRIAAAIGCDSADGTFLKYAPDQNMVRLMTWLADLHQYALFDLAAMP